MPLRMRYGKGTAKAVHHEADRQELRVHETEESYANPKGAR